jgi:2-keto-3-deoxy-L-arabinonate dehydratase
MTKRLYSGIWPVAPTPFHDSGAVDDESMKNALDCIIDQGVDGICILANFSEQFLISDAERDHLTKLCLAHIAGRVPVIVTISHFATAIAVERAQTARDLGAAIVMMMAPYHGALLKGTADQTFEQIKAVGEVGIPIMIQDAPLSGVDLSVPLLARMAHEIEMVKLFKIESTGVASKLRQLIAAGGASIEGPFDGEEAITLLADLDAGATGTMTSALIPDLIGPIIRAHLSGDRDAAKTGYCQVLPVINHENRQCGFRATKVAMLKGKVIKSDFCRHPIDPLHPDTKSGLFDLMEPLDPIVLRWGH